MNENALPGKLKSVRRRPGTRERGSVSQFLLSIDKRFGDSEQRFSYHFDHRENVESVVVNDVDEFFLSRE